MKPGSPLGLPAILGVQLDRPRDPDGAGTDGRRCNVRPSLPRHFLYPSLLLLLTEERCHGYRLVDALVGLGFGPVDRPSVYRALADLEGDGLLESSPEPPTAGSTRNVYSVTAKGVAVLDAWMAVVGRQRDCLDLVLARYTEASDSDELALAMNGHHANGGEPTH